MSNQLIIDNWLLQDIGQSLEHGLSSDPGGEIVIDSNNDKHNIKILPEYCIQIEALFSLLINIIYRDTLFVDSKFIGTWKETNKYFKILEETSILVPLDFLAEGDKLVEPRKLLVDKLCVTSSLHEIQRLNEKSWKNGLGVVDSYMSAVIWGGAGMLSRSHIYKTPYAGHPLRQRLIEQSIWKTTINDTTSNTIAWINSERFRFFESDEFNKQAIIVLPPVIIEVIEEAEDVNQLIEIAYQLRDKYKKIRGWLVEVQDAVDNEDIKRIAAYKRTLNAISNDINKLINKNSNGGITLGLGIEGISTNVSTNIIDNIVKRFGIRPLLHQQIMSPNGARALKKLLKLFGENNQNIHFELESYFTIKRF